MECLRRAATVLRRVRVSNEIGQETCNERIVEETGKHSLCGKDTFNEQEKTDSLPKEVRWIPEKAFEWKPEEW